MVSSGLHNLPFEDFLSKLAEKEWERFEAENKHAIVRVLLPTARESLADSLCSWIANYSEQVLFYEFCVFRALHWHKRSTGSETDRSIYIDFCGRLETGLWDEILESHRGLSSFLAKKTDCWHQLVHELLTAYVKDSPFQDTEVPSKVSEVRLAAGDIHDGKAVSLLTLDSGMSVVYKPTPPEPYRAYLEILGIIGVPRDHLDFQCCDGYHWVRALVPDIPNGDRFVSFRYGQCIALAYLLGITDLHYENVIFSGGVPHLIDLETMLTPKHNHFVLGSFETFDPNSQRFHSVLESGLLPVWQAFGSEQLVDVSPIGLEISCDATPATLWGNLNTDSMQSRRSTSASEQPLVSRSEILWNKDHILKGFLECWNLLADQRTSIYETLQGFRENSLARVVLRPTHTYALSTYSSLSPYCCESEASRRDFIASRLVPEYSGLDRRVHSPDVLDYEIDSVFMGEVPKFMTRWGSHDLRANGLNICSEFLKQSGWDGFIERLNALRRPKIRDMQSRLIRESLEIRFERECVHSADVKSVSNSKHDEIESEINQIVDELLASKIDLEGTSPSWLSSGIPDPKGRLIYEPLDAGVYNGKLGLTLFFFAFNDFFGNTVVGEIAEELKSELCTMLADLDLLYRFRRFYGVGIGTGIGSLQAGFSALARRVDADVANKCSRSLLSVAPDPEHDDLGSFELFSGSAGLLLGSTALANCSRGPHGLASYVNKLSDRVFVELDRSVRDGATPGLAHGASGTLLALFKAREMSVEQQTRGNLERLLSTVSRSAFDHRDLRHDSGMVPGAANLSWCWGLAGHAVVEACFLEKGLSDKEDMVSLGMLRDRYTKGILLEELPFVDNLCCGSAGLIDSGMTIFEITQDEVWLSLAKDVASIMIARKRKRGYYQLYPSTRIKIVNPSLFRGYAGIGYSLLRLRHKSKVQPAVTLFA